MNLNELKKKFEGRKKNKSIDLGFEIGKMITEARVKKGITQKQLAKKMGTQQPSIARVENGTVLASLDFLQKMAKAFRTSLVPPKFLFLSDEIPYKEIRSDSEDTHQSESKFCNDLLMQYARNNMNNQGTQEVQVQIDANKLKITK